MTPLAAPPNRVQTSGQASEAKTAQSVAQMFAAQAQTSTAGGSQDPPVFMGIKYTVNPALAGQGPGGENPIKTGTANTPGLSAVSGQYYQWDAKTKAKFLTQLSLAGYDTTNMSDDQLASAWAAYAQQSANYLAQGVQLTPWDIMSKDMKQRENSVAKTTTATSSNVQLSTYQDAHALFTQAAQSLLGRDPTKGESRNFLSTINAYEQEHPQITKTSTTTKGGQTIAQSSTTTGGASAAAESDVATQQAKKDPEYGAYQAATTYFNALMDMAGKS